MILDEADQLLLDDLKLLEAKFCVGLTATPFKKLDSLEGKYLADYLRFKVYDSGIVSSVDSAKPKIISSFERFFQENADRAKLIYGLDKDKAAISALAPDLRVNVADLSVTRNLSKEDCLFVDQEVLMRGIDYRAP